MTLRKTGFAVLVLFLFLAPLYAQTPSPAKIALKKWYEANERATFAVPTDTSSGSNVLGAIQFDGTSIWALKSDGRLYKCATADGSCGSAITSINGSGWITLGYDGKYLWAVQYGSGVVYRINPTSGSYSSVDVGSDAEGFTFDGKSVYISTYAGDIKRYNAATFASETGITLTSCGPQALAFDGTYVWASCWESGANKIIRIDFSGTPAQAGYASVSSRATTGLAWDGAYMWAALGTAGKVARIDPSSGSPFTVAEVTVPTASVRELAFDGRYVWATNGRYVTRIDTVYNSGCTSPGYCTKDFDLGSSAAARSVTYDGAHVWATDSNALTLFKF